MNWLFIAAHFQTTINQGIKMKKIFHVGHNDKQRKTHDIINGKKVARKEYQLWSSMLNRCYNPYMLNEKTAYIDCHVDEFFHSYTNFYDWCQDQVGFDFQHYHIDKDLLSNNGKIYSPETCLFLPRQINIAIKPHAEGVDAPSAPKTKIFHITITRHGITKSLGWFKTRKGSYAAYILAKKEYLKELASLYRNCIDKRAYDALISFDIKNPFTMD